MYSEKFEPDLSTMYISMVNMLKVEDSDSILEVAVGAGYHLPYLF